MCFPFVMFKATYFLDHAMHFKDQFVNFRKVRKIHKFSKTFCMLDFLKDFTFSSINCTDEASFYCVFCLMYIHILNT